LNFSRRTDHGEREKKMKVGGNLEIFVSVSVDRWYFSVVTFLGSYMSKIFKLNRKFREKCSRQLVKEGELAPQSLSCGRGSKPVNSSWVSTKLTANCWQIIYLIFVQVLVHHRRTVYWFPSRRLRGEDCYGSSPAHRNL
jgi:hypothetical protein